MTKINRAPVLTLWAAVVAEHLGFDWVYNEARECPTNALTSLDKNAA